jgi:hypothetical protein
VTAAALLARLNDLGVSATAEGGALRLRPASAISPDLMDDLRTHKAGLVALLTEPTTDQAQVPDTIARTTIRELERFLCAALQRPVSWADAAARPSRGCFCSCCKGQRWWGDARGWRCWQCHPPDCVPVGSINEVRS